MRWSLSFECLESLKYRFSFCSFLNIVTSDYILNKESLLCSHVTIKASVIFFNAKEGQLLDYATKHSARHVMQEGRICFTLRHNEVRDITATLLSDVCKNVELEPSLLSLNGKEQTMMKTAENDEVRLDIFVRNFWVSGQKAFFDVRVFDPNAGSYSKQTLKQCYSLTENEKKRYYNTRIMEVDQGSFTPLVFTIAGGIGGEDRAFYSRLATLLSLKNGIEKSKVLSWVRSKVNFALLRTMLLCLRGSRQKLVNKKLDIELEHTSITHN